MEDVVKSLRLSPKQEQAARLIARGWSQAETARDPRVSVSKPTINKWVNNDEVFKQRVIDLRTSADLRAIEVLQDSLDVAASVIAKVLGGEYIDVDARCKKDGASLYCAECGDKAEPSVAAALKERLSTARWLLDLQLKGKIDEKKQTTERDELDDTLDSLTPDELEDLMGSGEVDENDPFEHDEV